MPRWAAKAGGRLRVGIIPPPAGELEPHTYIDTGGLETGGITGEFLTRATQTPRAPARAGAELEAERRRDGVDVQAPPERQVPERRSVDAPTTSSRRSTGWSTRTSGSQALSAFKGVLSPGGIKKVDDLTVEFHLDAPTASFPYLTSSTTYQAIILPANYKIGHLREDAADDRRVQAHRVHAGRRREVRPQSRLVGRHGAARRRRRHLLHGRRGGRRGAARRPDRPDQPDPLRDGPRALQQLERADLQRARARRTARSRMRVDVKQPVQGLPRPPGDRALARPAGDRQDAVQRLRRPRQRLAVRAGLPVDGQDACRSATRTSRKAKQLMAAAGHPKGFSITLTTEQDGRDPAARADHPALGEGDRDQHEAEHPDRRRRTSPARRSARRRAGATRRG